MGAWTVEASWSFLTFLFFSGSVFNTRGSTDRNKMHWSKRTVKVPFPSHRVKKLSYLWLFLICWSTKTGWKWLLGLMFPLRSAGLIPAGASIRCVKSSSSCSLSATSTSQQLIKLRAEGRRSHEEAALVWGSCHGPWIMSASWMIHEGAAIQLSPPPSVLTHSQSPEGCFSVRVVLIVTDGCCQLHQQLHWQLPAGATPEVLSFTVTSVEMSEQQQTHGGEEETSN